MIRQTPILELYFDLAHLNGPGGNAFALLGRAQKMLRAVGIDKDLIDEFMEEATGGDYDNLLATIRKWFVTDV